MAVNTEIVWSTLYEIYCGEKSGEEKVSEVLEMLPELKQDASYREDLKLIFDTKPEDMPFIEGVEMETEGLDKDLHQRIFITKMPEKVSADIQKAVMRVGGCVGGFSISKWGVGDTNLTEAIRKHKEQYEKDYGICFIPGAKAHYPRVLILRYDVENAVSNRKCTITGVIGLIMD